MGRRQALGVAATGHRPDLLLVLVLVIVIVNRVLVALLKNGIKCENEYEYVVRATPAYDNDNE